MILFAADFIEKGEEEELVLLLYDKYNRLIYKKIRDKTGAQRGVVEDLVNDTFIRLIEKIETLKALGAIGSIDQNVTSIEFEFSIDLRVKSADSLKIDFPDDLELYRETTSIPTQ